MSLVESLFPITKNDITRVREFYKKSEGDIHSDIEILRRWLQEQRHLPEHHENDRLERFLLRNQFDIDACKKKIDMYFTLRGLHSDCFTDIDPTSELMQNTRKAIIWSPMPTLTPEMERVFIFRLREENHLYVYQNCMTYILAVLDIQLSHDYAIGDRIVYDLSGYNMNHFKTINLNILAKTLALYQSAFSGHLTGLDFINTPPFMHLMTNMLKMFFNPKLFNKIVIHENLQSLHERIPKECLPVEYGGTARSSEQIHDDMGKLMLEKREFILTHAKRIAKESARVGDINLNDAYGVNETFTNLEFD